jgi:pullulanase
MGVMLSSRASAEVVSPALQIRVADRPESTDQAMHWAVRQGGRIVAEGTLDPTGRAGEERFELIRRDVRLDDGPAELLACVNRDKLLSHHPSFGDLFAVVSFEIKAGRAEVELPADRWQEYRPSATDNVLTIHYHRFDADYSAPGLWTWDEEQTLRPQDQEVFAVGRSEFGVVFQIDTAKYGQGRIGLLPRLRSDWQHKDGGDRFWTSSMGREVWLVQDRDEVYSKLPDVSPRLLGARIASELSIIVRFTHRLPVVDFPSARFTIRDEEGSHVAVSSVEPQGEHDGRAGALRLRVDKPLEFMKREYTLTVDGFAPATVVPGEVLVESKRFFDPSAVLGATYTKDATTFRVFSPGAEHVEVLISAAHTGGEPLITQPMTVNDHGVWSVQVPGDWKGKFYGYRLRGPVLDPTREVTDIYAHCTTGPSGRGMIVDLAETNPPGFSARKYVPLESPVDAVIYEMHVRDFTIAPNSGVTLKGKFLGLTEAGTRHPNDASIVTGLDHLVELGVTHVQIMPIQDFENVETDDDQYNWGYMPINFSSPDGWFATKIVGPQRVIEFKKLVQALHDRGIGVIMDVVYNHTAQAASFDYLCHGYYYRRLPDGSYWNGSGCGNELASEHPMARKFMLDSVKYWVSEYGVDGFRFDLMGLHDLETMLLIRDELKKINPSVLVYGEPWTGGASGLNPVTDQHRIAGTGIGAFNDRIRDAIKGGRDGGASGFIQTGVHADAIRRGVMGAVDDWAKQPTECITYSECHDNLTTWDKLLQSVPDASEDTLKRMQRLAGLIVMTSQGVAFIHSGQEFCRGKGGNHNSYNAPDSVNQVDWSLKGQHRDVYDYHRGLIALRKANPAFRLRTAEDIRRRIHFRKDVPTERCVAWTIDGAGLPGRDHSMTMVLLNGEKTDHVFNLPPGRWRVLVDADHAGVETLREAEGTVRLAGHTGMVLER